MDNTEFETYRTTLETECRKVLDDRGPAYAGEGGDRLANFRLIAKLLDNFHVETNNEMGTWAVYFLKHVFSILAYIGQGTEGEEKIQGRIVDARNYLDLFYGMVRDANRDTGQMKAKHLKRLVVMPRFTRVYTWDIPGVARDCPYEACAYRGKQAHTHYA